MAVITLQIGQCGNQLGTALFSLLAAELNGGNAKVHRSRFFYEQRAEQSTKQKWLARAVLVDTESKAVAQSLQPRSAEQIWKYDARYAINLRTGAGNCWASGRNRMSKLLLPKVLAAIKSQIGKCEKVDAILILHSLAGGTGSGVGSYITEKLAQALHDETPLVNVAILPHSSGEVAVQNLNVCLALSNLAKCSSAIFLFSNDSVHETCERHKAASTGVQRGSQQTAGRNSVNVSDLNEEICRQLCLLLLPSKFVIDPRSGRTSHAPANISIRDVLALFDINSANQKLLSIYCKVSQLKQNS